LPPGDPRLLPSASQFVANHSAQGGLDRFLPQAREAAQRFVDERLTVTAAGVVNLLAKSGQNFVIQADRDFGSFPVASLGPARAGLR